MDPDADPRDLESLAEVERVRAGDRGFEVLLKDGSDPAAAMRRVMDMMPAVRIELSRPRLEDIFVQLVSEGTAGDQERLRAELHEAEMGGASI
jgi:hypothetical protein